MHQALIVSSALETHKEECTSCFQWLLTLFTTFHQKQSHGTDCVRTNESDNNVISQQIPRMLYTSPEIISNSKIIAVKQNTLFFVFLWDLFWGFKVKVKSLSHVWLCGPVHGPGGLQSMEFSRQEYQSGLPFSSPGDLPDPGIEPGSPALQEDAFTIWATREALIEHLL